MTKGVTTWALCSQGTNMRGDGAYTPLCKYVCMYVCLSLTLSIATYKWPLYGAPISCTQDFPYQCPMLINTDQCRSKFWHGSQCWSIPINADQFWSIPLNFSELRGIDRHWSAMIGIERHFRSMPWFWSALIDIDGHWAMIEGVLCTKNANS